MTQVTDDHFLTAQDVAKLLGISPDTVRRWDKQGLIKSHRNSQNYRVFHKDSVSELNNKINGDFEGENRYKILQNKEKTEYKVIDLFSGAGGTAMGFENAGLQHELLVEIDKNAAATLRKNFKNTKIIEADVSKVDFTKYKGVDVVEGGFPCQSFSYAGKQRGFEDARGTLFFEFARCIKETQPKIAIGENVRGLINHENGKTLQTMVSILNDMGYRVSYKLLKAQYLDVPQKRERLIIIAIRKDLDLPFLFPKEKNYTIFLKEALENVPKSEGQKYNEKKKKVLDLVPEGGYWRDLPIEIQKEYMGASFYLGGGKTGMARRMSWNEPSLTLVCSPAQKQTERCHPLETRPFTIREYARIQTFPDDWDFQGSVSAQYKQIGNAVPVNMGFHVGNCVIAMLENKPNLEEMVIGQETITIEEQGSLF
jgi:DNA (cytosine-5)-methyltransferase 1